MKRLVGISIGYLIRTLGEKMPWMQRKKQAQMQWIIL